LVSNIKVRTQATGFENKVLGKISWASEREVTEDWGKLHDDEIYDLYCFPYIIWVIKSIRVRFVMHVACVRDKCAQGFERKP
jgi:hypothetical protein